MMVLKEMKSRDIVMILYYIILYPKAVNIFAATEIFKNTANTYKGKDKDR